MNANILMPITESQRLSFAEMVGPKQTKYFVSYLPGALVGGLGGLNMFKPMMGTFFG